jgi:ADP-ribosyl-[dinitrogen reductase] hydrolase
MRLLRRGDDRLLFDRARGVMLGLAVGDALGAALEWSHPEQIEQRYGGPLRDLVASPVWELGEWTDDTAMAVALAESLADRGGYDENDLVARYLVWSRSKPKDIGVTVSKALARARTPDDARAAAARWHEESGGKSAGNGALMRTAPIAIRYRRNAEELIRVSRAEAELTHHDPLAGEVCAFFNMTLAAHLNGRTPRRSTTEPGRAAFEAPELSRDQLLELVQRQIGFVLTALRVAFWSCAHTDSFEGAVVAAANLGGDADTNAAVTGALAGAQYGAGAIPERWLEPLHRRDHIGGLAMRLLRS